MTIGEIDTKISALCNVDQTVYTEAQRLIDVNIWQYKVQSMIFNSMDEVDFDDKNYANYPEVTAPMVAGQRDYTIPTSEAVVSIKRVDVTYDGTNWYRAEPMDDGEMEEGLGPSSATAQNAKVDQNYPITAPRYDPTFNSFRIYPAANAAQVAAGASIFVTWLREVQPFTASDYTAGTKVPGFDTEFHPILAYGAAYEFFIGTGQKADAQFILNMLNDFEGRLVQTYGKKELDRTNQLRPAYNNFK